MTGTLGKALGGASGGPIRQHGEKWSNGCGSASRPYLFSNTLAPVIAATSPKVFDMIEQGGRPSPAALRQCRALFATGWAASASRSGGAGPPHHPGHDRRCSARGPDGGTLARPRHLCGRLFLPRRAERARPGIRTQMSAAPPPPPHSYRGQSTARSRAFWGSRAGVGGDCLSGGHYCRYCRARRASCLIRMNLNVRIRGALRDFVAEAVSDGDYENVSEYVRALIRREQGTRGTGGVRGMKIRLQDAFAVPR